MVAAIQLAIMLGAAFGGLLLDRASISATWVGGAAPLVLASLAAGSGRRLRPTTEHAPSRTSASGMPSAVPASAAQRCSPGSAGNEARDADIPSRL